MTPARRYLPEAAGLLLVGGVAQYAWKQAAIDAQVDVWNISQAMVVLVLLGMVCNAYRSGWVWACAALVAVWQALTVGCSLLWLAAPWPVLPGQEQCSARFDVPLGAIGLWLLLLLAAAMSQRLEQPNGGGHGAR
jgi:hypothetical protein